MNLVYLLTLDIASMPLDLLNRYLAKTPMHWVLIVPFVLQTVGAVGLVGYLSYYSGQRTVQDLASQLLEEVSNRVSDRLDHHLQIQQQVVAANQQAVRGGRLNVNNREQLRTYLWQQMSVLPQLSPVQFISAKGEQIGYGRLHSQTLVEGARKLTGENLSLDTLFFISLSSPQVGERNYYWVDAQGVPRKRVYTLDVDSQRLLWHGNPQSTRRPTWSPIFVDPVTSTLSIYAMAPLYDAAGHFQGVFNTETALSEVDAFLHQLQFSPSGYSFIMERSGDLVASSVQEPSFAVYATGGEPVRLSAAQSHNAALSEVAQQILDRFGGLEKLQTPQQLSLEGDRQNAGWFTQNRQFVQITPYRDAYGLDWLIVTVVPESDFTQEIHKNLWRTLLLCGITLLGTMGLGIVTAYALTRPILRLNQAAKTMAEGQPWHPSIPISGVSEVAELAASFHQMSSQLEQSFQALRASEQKLETFLNSLPIGVSVFDHQGQAILINPAGRSILGLEQVSDLPLEHLSKALGFYLAGTDQPYPLEQLPTLRALQGEAASVENIEIERAGKRLPLELHAIPIQDESGQVVYAINAFQDITERHQVEQLRASYARDLEHQVAARTEALVQSKARLAMAQRLAHMGNWEWNLVTQERVWSQEAFRIFGLSPNQPEPTAAEMLKRVHPDDRKQWIDYVQRLIDQASGSTLEYRIMLADGTVRYLETRDEVLCDDQGRVVKLFGALLDITERKQLELALQASEARINGILNSAIAAIVSLTVFPDGNWGINQISAGCEVITGYTPADLTCNRELWINRIPLEDWQVLEPRLAADIQAEQTSTYEYRFRHKNGKLRWFSQITSSRWDPVQNAWMVTAVASDISDRKQTERALKQALQQIDKHFDESPFAIVEWDREKHVLRWSKQAEQMFGWESSEILSLTWDEWQFIYSEDHDRVNTALAPLINGAVSHVILQNRNYTKDGRVITCEWHTSAVFDEAGQLASMLSFVKDISERQQAEHEVRQQKELREAIFNESTDAIFLVDPATLLITDCNQRAVELFEVSAKADLIGVEGRSLQRYPFTETEIEQIHQAMQQQGFWSGEVEYITHRGNAFWGNLAAKPLQIADQAVNWVRVTDISDRKRAENERRQTQDALQNSEARTRAILTAIPDIITLVSADGIYLDCMQTDALRNLVTEEMQPIGKHLNELLPAEVAECHLQAIHRAIATQRPQIYEQQIWVQGQLQYEEMRVVACGDRAALLIIRDISDRKRAEAALRQSEATNRALVQAIPDLLIRMHRDGTYLDVKESLTFPMLRSADQLLNANIHDILPPAEAQRRTAAIHQALETQEIQTYEFPLEIQQEMHWQEIRIIPLGTDEVLIVVRDLTERKQTEEALRQSEERFRRAFDDAAIGMALVTPEGQLLKVNRSLCEIIGYGEAELLTCTLHTLTHPEDRELDQEYIQQMLSGERRMYQVQKRYLHRQGHIVWVLLSVSLIKQQNDRPLYFVTQIQDISDRYAVDRIKDEFISIVSHELRTPLTAIRGSLGILESGVFQGKPDNIQRMLQIALSNSDRLVRLVNDILDLERLESGKVQLVMQVCAVDDLMQQAVEAVQPIATQSEVRISYTSLMASVWAAPDAIIQTLTNLLSNAIKFSSAGSLVHLTATVMQEDRILFSIQDQGRGIPPGKLETIFGRFQQVDVSDSRQKGGTGLGLAICKSIVQQHQGHIWVESTLGHGSTFYFTLPAAN